MQTDTLYAILETKQKKNGMRWDEMGFFCFQTTQNMVWMQKPEFWYEKKQLARSKIDSNF